MRQLLTKKEILTIPNALSMVRILLIPLFIWLYVTEAQPYGRWTDRPTPESGL